MVLVIRMTQEQIEEWQRAIMPVAFGVLDQYEMTEAGLVDSLDRLKFRGVPGWAIELRRQCISAGWEEKEPWVPEFTLRSETALVGLQLLYPTSSARIDVYRRVFLQFYYDALKPFENQAEESSPALGLVRQYYEKRHEPIVEQEWRDALKTVTSEYHNAAAGHPETLDLLTLVRSLFRDWQSVLLRPSEYDSWWNSPRTGAISDLVHRLNQQHQWQIEGSPADDMGGIYTDVIAQTFLTALEAECPEPEWMPR